MAKAQKITKSRLPIKITQDRVLNILTLVLLVIAFVVGYKIYQTSSTSTPEDFTSPNAQVQNNSDAPVDDVLVTPLRTDSDDRKKQYEELVRSKAEDADIIQIKDCKPEPLVTKVADKAPVTIRNNSTKDHIFTSYDGKESTLPAGKETKLDLTFGFGPGVYAYGCDKSAGPVGILLVE